MNKIKSVALLLILSVGGSLLAQANAELKNSVNASEPVCISKCTSGEREVTILNRRNRYTEKGAMQRRMYPRFLHSSIKPVKIICQCSVCHVVKAS